MYSTGYCCQIVTELGIIPTYFRKKNTEISNITKTGPLAAQLLHEDGRTDMTKLIVAFGNSLY